MSDSPSEPFDPCREWLGLDRADLADPRRLLGLVPSERDPLTVLRAAEARLALLKGLAAGQHHAARESLILRVEQARETVLSQIAAAAPAERRTGSGFAMPPPPQRAANQADEEAGVVFPHASVEERGAAVPEVRIRAARPVRRRDGNAAIWISLLAMLASVAAGVAFIWWQADGQQRRVAARTSAPSRGVADPDSGEGPLRPLPEDAAVSSSPPPKRTATPSSSPKARPSGERIATATPRPAPAAPSDDDAMSDAPSAPSDGMASAVGRDDAGSGDSDPPDAGDPVGAMAGDDTTDEPGSGSGPDADPPPGATEVATDGSMTTPDSASEDLPSDDGGDSDMTMADAPEDAGAPGNDGDPEDDGVEAALSQTLDALRDGDFDTADSLLASALEGAATVAAKRRIAAWKVLAEYAREFAGYRAKALAEVRSGNEFDVNGKKVAVVEIDDKKFIYRFQGRNKTVSRDKIPAGILLSIVSTWFDERPANHLYLGAHHATKPEPDLARAKDHWERAEKGGINAEPLLGLLDDPLLRGDAGDDSGGDP